MARNSVGGFASLAAALAMACTALLSAGCATATDDELAASAAPGRTSGPVDTGTFPNLNIPARAATSQFTQEERDAKLAKLNRSRERQAPGSGGETPDERRRRLQLLADKSQANTLRVIEQPSQ